MQGAIGLRAALCVAVAGAAVAGARPFAEDAAPARTGSRGRASRNWRAPTKPADAARETDTREAMCLMIESAARANGLPLEFFARVIWQESRFQSDAVGPVTRSGQRAQGIAQFMPGTASERRLLDPFDPGAGAAEIGGVPERAARTSSAISGLRRPPTMPARGGCRNGSPAPARCRRRRAIMSPPSPAPRSMTGPTAGKNGKMPDARRRRQLPRADGLAQARAQSLRHRARAAREACCGEIMGRAARRRLRPQQGAGDVCARDEAACSAVIGDQDPSLLSSVLRSRGTRTFYQVRIGADTRPRPTISATASAAPAAPVSCCEISGADRGRRPASPPLTRLQP